MTTISKRRTISAKETGAYVTVKPFRDTDGVLYDKNETVFNLDRDGLIQGEPDYYKLRYDLILIKKGAVPQYLLVSHDDFETYFKKVTASEMAVKDKNAYIHRSSAGQIRAGHGARRK